MTAEQLLEKYLGFIWNTFMYDVEVFSQGWMYYFALVPAFFYLIFFFVKWSFLMSPFWMPVRWVRAIIKSMLKTKDKIKKEEAESEKKEVRKSFKERIEEEKLKQQQYE